MPKRKPTRDRRTLAIPTVRPFSSDFVKRVKAEFPVHKGFKLAPALNKAEALYHTCLHLETHAPSLIEQRSTFRRLGFQAGELEEMLERLAPLAKEFSAILERLAPLPIASHETLEKLSYSERTALHRANPGFSYKDIDRLKKDLKKLRAAALAAIRLVPKGPRGRRKEYALRELIHQLAEIYTAATSHAKLPLGHDRVSDTYHGSFFVFVHACLTEMGIRRQKPALGRFIARLDLPTIG